MQFPIPLKIIGTDEYGRKTFRENSAFRALARQTEKIKNMIFGA